MIVLKNLTKEELFAIEEIKNELTFFEAKYDITVSFSTMNDDGIRIDKSGQNVHIQYSTRSSLLRAFVIFIEHIDDEIFSIAETPVFERLTLLVDNSRNAVMKPESIKKLVRIMAMMGYSGLMLYTEDTFKLEKYPYFGYMRGAFTVQEFKDIDDYAFSLGIELIPCIQTLAHLENIFRWKSFSKIHDSGDALLCDEEQTYELIDNMLKTLSVAIRSRRINIGMDEADAVGSGKHIDKFGYEERADIILRHLNRVNDLCKKYGYTPTIWSDVVSKRNLTADGQINDAILSRIPKGIGLTFWSYESTNETFYNDSFKKHLKVKDNPVSFAGSSCSWFGWAPLNRFSFNVLKVALPKAKENNIKDVTVTIWGNNGADASSFASLTTLQHYAEYCWKGEINEENVAKRFLACVGADYDSFMNMESLCNLPGREDFGFKSFNPYRYILYQDILLGLFDRHIPKGSGEYFDECAKIMSAYPKNNKWSYLFETLTSLCEVLKFKAELSIKIYNAYHFKDNNELKRISEDDIPKMIDALDTFLHNYREQWYKENKMYGFEVQNIRIAGIKARAIETQNIINEYISGVISKIELLEEERLYYNDEKTIHGEPVICHAVNWDKNVTPSTI